MSDDTPDADDLTVRPKPTTAPSAELTPTVRPADGGRPTPRVTAVPRPTAQSSPAVKELDE